jgi:hypothetical protein
MIVLAAILVITGSVSFVGFYYYECDLNGQFCIPGPLMTGPKSELITLDHYLVTTGSNQQYPTVLTVWIKNVGSSTTNIQYVSVSNSSGAYYGRTVSTSITPGNISSSTLDVSTGGFYFKTGQIYSVSVSTATGHYVFTINN